MYACLYACIYIYASCVSTDKSIGSSLCVYASLHPSILASARPHVWMDRRMDGGKIHSSLYSNQRNSNGVGWLSSKVQSAVNISNVSIQCLITCSNRNTARNTQELLGPCPLGPWCCPPAHTGTWKISTVFPNWNSWHPFYGNYWKLVEGDSCRFYPGPSVEWKLTITTRITASVCWSARTQRKPVVLEELLVPCPAWPSWNLDSSST